MSSSASAGGFVGNAVAPTSAAATGIFSIAQVYNLQRAGRWLFQAAPQPVPGFQISRSLRFNSADSAYLSRTPNSAGNRGTWTWSAWLKITAKTTDQYLFTAGSAGGGGALTGITYSGNQFRLWWGSSSGGVTLTPLYRDPSAWYHLCLVANVTAGFLTLYVNGIFVGQRNISGNGAVNDTGEHAIGTTINFGSGYLNPIDGYLAEIHFIDGQALTPSDFGETDAITGQWKAKRYTGTYGTNGFYLTFADNSNTTSTTLGKDQAGNNNWTPYNFSVDNVTNNGVGNDSLTDVPDSYGTDTGLGGQVGGNYCTLNPLNKAPNRITLKNGNLDLEQDASGNGNWNNCTATMGVTQGKWYWEVIRTSANEQMYGVIGSEPTTNNIIADNTPFNWTYYTSNSVAYYSNTTANQGTIVKDGQVTVVSNLASFTTGDVIGLALDADAKTLAFYKNNSLQYTHTFSPLLSAPLIPAFAVARNGGTMTFSANFGQRPFKYAAPEGFKALCTANLTTPVIQKPSTAMDVVTYTGNGSTSRIISGLGFSPDLVWTKSRTDAYNHRIHDSVRGTNKTLFSNTTDAEINDFSVYGELTSFNSDGWDISTSGLAANFISNLNSKNYVAWAWDAGSSSSSNNSGTITSNVRVNALAGFSIVGYTGNGTNNSTVGHGLGTSPKLVIVKNRTTTSTDWPVYHSSLAANNVLFLHLTQEATAISSRLYGAVSAASSTTFTVTNGSTDGRNVNKNGDNHIAYCFAEVEGYSKIGSYTGNNSTDGPFVYCGFRPRWILFKNATTAYHWQIYDTARNTFNVVNSNLYSSSPAAEQADASLDIVSNGFKLRSALYINDSSNTIIFAAFAESPFKYARAR